MRIRGSTFYDVATVPGLAVNWLSSGPGHRAERMRPSKEQLQRPRRMDCASSEFLPSSLGLGQLARSARLRTRVGPANQMSAHARVPVRYWERMQSAQRHNLAGSSMFLQFEFAN